MYYRYSGFLEFKAIILNATIAFLIALSGKQISKKLLIDEGIITPEAVQDLDEGILNTRSGPPPEDPILKMFGGGGGSLINPMGNLGRLLDQRAFMAQMMAEFSIDFNAVNPKDLDPAKVTPPHTLTELRLAGIHAFVLFPDNDGTLPYEMVKEVERLLRTVRSYCEWDEKWGGPPPPPEHQPPRVRVPPARADESSDEKDGGSDESAQGKEDGRSEMEDEDEEMDPEDEQHFIDEMITVFAAVPPGGTART
ncbi:hypothetical protein DFH09DRAFT_1383610 [Mycena vulgaris]|nr:hypothetical protein DFH09DRAFT_1383610 [Mycena vulgaris]